MAKWTAGQKRRFLHENMKFLDQADISANYIVGMDFSLTSTGIVVLDGDGKFVEKSLVTTSSNSGTMMERLEMIGDKFLSNVVKKYQPEIVSFEAINVTKNPSSFKALSIVYGSMLHAINSGYENKRPYLFETYVTSIKKAATGDPSADKNRMLLEVFDKWGQKFKEDDIADAYVVAKLASFIKHFADVYNKHKPEGEDVYQFLLDLYKGRKPEFKQDCIEAGMDDKVYEVMLSGFEGKSGLRHLSNNNKNFYNEARERVKKSDD